MDLTKIRLKLLSRIICIEVNQLVITTQSSSSSNAAGVGGDPRPQISTLLCHRSSDSRSLHFSFVVDYHPSIVLKVYENTILPPERLPLPNHHCLHD